MIKQCFGYEKSKLNDTISYFHLICSPYCSKKTQERVITELHRRLRPSIVHLSNWGHSELTSLLRHSVFTLTLSA